MSTLVRVPAVNQVDRNELPLSRLEPLDASPQYDAGVLFGVGALMTLGVVMVFSASVRTQGVSIEWNTWWNSPLKQCIFAVAGFIAMLVAAHFDFEWFSGARRGLRWTPAALYLVAVGLAVAVLVVGTSALGAVRAIVVLRSPVTVSFQPSEFGKLALTVWLASLLSHPRFQIRSLVWGFLPAMASAGLLIALTGIEDFGTAALMGVVTMFVLIMAGARWSHMVGTGLLGLLAGGALIWMKPYRLQRIMTFLSPPADPHTEAGAAFLKAEGYQVNQSLNAIGLGGWWGRGLGASLQKQGYLPQINNDFIFAMVCEEIGVIGAFFVIALYLFLLWRGWRIAHEAHSRFGRLLAAGIALTLCMQAAFNIGVVTDSIPTKGISLPFVSAGGSGVIFLSVAAGLLASIWRGPRRRAQGVE